MEPQRPDLFDAHCHLDWFRDPARVCDEAAGRGLSLLAVTVTPDGWRAARGALDGRAGVLLAAGLHPWWLCDGRAGERDVDALVDAIGSGAVRAVGEVGLDLSPRRAPDERARAVQRAAFGRVCAAAAAGGTRGDVLLSVHSVRAATEVLDALERSGAAARCRCVLHWFAGSTPELQRAMRLGCWFSFGERALATGRGREYARLVPAARLLAETDLPPEPGSDLGALDVARSLARAAEGLAAVRRVEAAEARALLARNARALLDGLAPC